MAPLCLGGDPVPAAVRVGAICDGAIDEAVSYGAICDGRDPIRAVAPATDEDRRHDGLIEAIVGELHRGAF